MKTSGIFFERKSRIATLPIFVGCSLVTGDNHCHNASNKCHKDLLNFWKFRDASIWDSIHEPGVKYIFVISTYQANAKNKEYALFMT